MDMPAYAELAPNLIDAATSFGASLAGLTTAADIEKAPSRAAWKGAAAFPSTGTILVMALVHGAANPAMDWWDGPNGGTPGNRRLLEMSRRVCEWLDATWGIHSRDLPYAPEKGGVFLKDAAVLAGLGAIGKNNLVITPEYGPRVRLRGVHMDVDIPMPGIRISASPCDECDKPCFLACPQNAFASQTYCKDDCQAKMLDDESTSFLTAESEGKLAVITYCRDCELSCPLADGI